MLTHLIILLSFVGILHYYAYATSSKFTNIECEAYDKPFADFKECKLKVLGRGIIGMSMYLQLYQIPVNNVTINLSLYKKYSGYRPFMFNQTANFCKIMSNKSGPISFLKIFFNALVKDSNINHTCPYDHDIIIKNMIVEEDYLRFLPLPGGEYKFQLKVAAYNDWKANVNAYILRRDTSLIN